MSSSEEDHGFIYKVTCPEGKVYVGQVREFMGKKRAPWGVHARWNMHCSVARRAVEQRSLSYPLCDAIMKFGKDKFKVETLCKVPVSELNDAEKKAIAEHNSLAPNGYNVAKGGAGKNPVEAGQRKGEALKKLLEDPEKRKAWSEAKKGVAQNAVKARKSPESEGLPKYILFRRQTVKGRVYEGYVIDSHPLCRTKRFGKSKLTLEENLEAAKKYLDELNAELAKRAVQRLDVGGSLPLDDEQEAAA